MVKDLGWKMMMGISNTTITNGMYPEEEGASGTKRYMPDIEVFIPDLTPNASGKPATKDSAPMEEVEVTDPFTHKTAKSTVYTMQTVKCHYMGQPNWLVPCVHVGEQVWVFSNHGEENSYYWLPMSHCDEGIRLHEHMRWFLMNQSKSVSKGKWKIVDDDNTYFIDINTNKGKKLIQIHTAKNDGEPYGYDIRIKPEESRLEIIDTVGNELSLDSANTIWYMRNIDNSFLQLNKTDITLSCLNNMTIFAGNNMSVTVGNNRITNIGVNDTRNVGQIDTTIVGANIVRTSVGGNILDTAAANYILAAALIQEQAPVYNNLSAAIALSGGTIALTAATGINLTALQIGLMGGLTNIFTAHGNINALVW